MVPTQNQVDTMSGDATTQNHSRYDELHHAARSQSVYDESAAICRCPKPKSIRRATLCGPKTKPSCPSSWRVKDMWVVATHYHRDWLRWRHKATTRSKVLGRTVTSRFWSGARDLPVHRQDLNATSHGSVNRPKTLCSLISSSSELPPPPRDSLLPNGNINQTPPPPRNSLLSNGSSNQTPPPPWNSLLFH